MPDPVEPPRIDGRKASDLRRQLLRAVPHYTPEWPAAAPDDPGMALVDAFALLAEGVIQQLNRVPEKSFIQFLNLLGVQLAPARPATVPVQFRPSTGLAAPVLVRARTRCAAPARPPRTEDLPFETAEDLWAVPAALQALVSVDPVADAIHTPPPGFLALREAARPLPEYATVSFTAAGSGTLQLDRVDGLEPGDLLRVVLPGDAAGAGADSMDCTVLGPGDAAREAHLHLEVAGKPDGRIVPVRGRMDADLPSGTRVEKVTEFALFDSLNLQEHVLYLGHAELLNVKSAATFTVSIDPLEAGAVLPGFPIAWEYAAKGEAGSGVEWRAFGDAADTSDGFGRAGVVELAKPEGEIIEAMVAGRTSRWIRARVVGPIPAVPRPRMPRLERVRLRVKSETSEAPDASKGIPPDQTFHNDTPLQLPDIYPFGPEPRQFDRFYIASQEVFSKPNARVTLTFRLRERASGPPAATFYGDRLQVFARNLFGHLSQLTASRGAEPAPRWIRHDPLPRNVLLAADTRPAVTPLDAPVPMVFVRGDDGTVYLRFPAAPDASRWVWGALGNPGVKLVYDLVVACLRVGEERLLRVFAAGEDGGLYSAVVHAHGGFLMRWDQHPPLPEGRRIASPPAIIADGQGFRVYVADDGGVIWEYANSWARVWPEDRNGDGKKDPPRDEELVRAAPRVETSQQRPDLPSRLALFAEGYRGQHGLVRILAYVNVEGDLMELTRREADTGWTARPLGSPSADLVSSPTGAYLRPGEDLSGRHLFVRDATGGLWERTVGLWRQAGQPVGRELREDPAALLVHPQDAEAQLLSVFSATESHFLVEYRQEQAADRVGRLAGGPERALVLGAAEASDAAAPDPSCVLITAGPGQGQHRGIDARGADDRLLRVDRAWSTLPEDSSRYALVSPVTQGIATAATQNSLHLVTDPSGATGATVARDVRSGQLVWIEAETGVGVRRITTVDPGTGRVEFAPSWPGLADSPRYAVVATVTVGTSPEPPAQEAAEEEGEEVGEVLTLDLTQPGARDVEPGQLIRIRGGTDEVVRTITRAPDANGRVAFAPAWPEIPARPAYEVFAPVEHGAVSADTAHAVILDKHAPGVDGAYEGELLRIVAEKGAGRESRIRTYSARPRLAILESVQAGEVDSTSIYEIGATAEWLQYEDMSESNLQPELSWEYWNGRGWLRLTLLRETTGKLLSSGEVEFELPPGLVQTEVAGQENFWIRVRLVGGDYGRETFVVSTDPARAGEPVQVRRDTILPPLVRSLTLRYVLNKDLLPQHCITLNNLAFLDETAACQTDGKHFEPFQPLEDSRPALYLGFDRPLEGGPVRILLAADERDAEGANRPRMTWSFRTDNAWRALPADDRSEGLVRQGLLSLQLPKGFQQRSQFGRSLFWLRGSVDDGEYRAGQEPVLRGVFPNTVDAVQAATVLDESLGSSDGEPGQELRFLTAPPGDPRPDWSLVGTPEIRVREVLSAEERAALEAELGPGGVATRTVLGEEQTWVLWTDVDTFVHSTPGSRHYRLDPARGRVRFGDGRRGMIPPAGTDNLRAFTYQAGGGAAGNVGAGEIQTLVTAVAGVDSVRNPVPAGGGGDVATTDEMLRQGAARISHRGRAVAPGDFEWHAREASGEVVKARCAAAADARGHVRAGWVTVYVVPRSVDDRPTPSLELRRAVERHLRAVGELGLSAAGRISVQPPRYLPVSVEADVFAASLDRVAAVEQEVHHALREFLHPLRGGPRGAGWDFGRPVAVSDLFVVLEGIGGVDHVENLRLHFAGRASGERVQVGRDELVAWAAPRIRMRFV